MNTKYFDGLNEKLFECIPEGSKRILELGCAYGKLGFAYKSKNNLAHWTGVDISSSALDKARDVLDAVVQIDLNNISLLESFPPNSFDTIVIGDLLEHLINPEKLISELFSLSTSDGKIICCLPNMSHVSVVQKIISGDITYDEMGLLDKTHLRFFSQPSVFKLFLDGGWLPSLKNQYRTPLQETPFLQGVLHAAQSLGISQNTALKNLGLYQMIIECVKRVDMNSCENGDPTTISVVVPVNRQWEFEENILKSPGLSEINAEIIPVYDATSAAEAYAFGRERALNDWVLFAHQDVYIPKGAGRALISRLSASNLGNKPYPPIGFAGIDVPEDLKLKKSGLMIDRDMLFSHLPSNNAISIDEFAVLIHKDAQVTIDPNLGWHTWATDLCLQVFISDEIKHARIFDIPFFHNSLNYTPALPDAYVASAKTLKQKWPQFQRIQTLCGAIV